MGNIKRYNFEMALANGQVKAQAVEAEAGEFMRVSEIRDILLPLFGVFEFAQRFADSVDESEHPPCKPLTDADLAEMQAMEPRAPGGQAHSDAPVVYDAAKQLEEYARSRIAENRIYREPRPVASAGVNKSWNTEHTDFLRNNYGAMTAQDIADMLGRSRASVEQKAFVMKLKKLKKPKEETPVKVTLPEWSEDSPANNRLMPQPEDEPLPASVNPFAGII